MTGASSQASASASDGPSARPTEPAGGRAVPRLFSLAGRVALITGSSRGIGFALAEAFAEAGARVVLHGASPASAQAARSGLGERFPGVVALHADLGEPGAARALVQAATARVAAPDIVVHCASIEQRTPWEAIGWAEAEQQLRINLLAGLELFQAAVGPMRERRWGRLIAVGSVQQVKPHPDMLVYAASKCALASVMRNLAVQLAASGITANVLAPGAIATDRTAGVLADPGYAARVVGSIPLGFVGEPRDCAGAALLLASEAGRYISGETILVDGLKNF